MGKVRGTAGTLGRTGVRCAEGPTPYEKLRTNDYSGSQESKVLFLFGQCPMPHAPCPMPHAQCPVCPMPKNTSCY